MIEIRRKADSWRKTCPRANSTQALVNFSDAGKVLPTASLPSRAAMSRCPVPDSNPGSRINPQRGGKA
jgi:hypothetical protein